MNEFRWVKFIIEIQCQEMVVVVVCKGVNMG